MPPGDTIERIRDGRCDLVFDHLAAGGGADARDAGGVPLIKWCAYYGDVSAIKALLAAGETLASLGDNHDLNGAAFHGHWQLCEFLLDRGADPNREMPNGERPLHAALTKAGRPQTRHVVATLLASGADPNAAAEADAETGCFMRDVRTRGETPLHRAAAFGSEEVVRMLLDAGASASARDAHGDSPLSWASWHLRPSGILRLLCFDDYSIDGHAHWIGDHGRGASAMEWHLLGNPHGSSG